MFPLFLPPPHIPLPIFLCRRGRASARLLSCVLPPGLPSNYCILSYEKKKKEMGKERRKWRARGVQPLVAPRTAFITLPFVWLEAYFCLNWTALFRTCFNMRIGRYDHERLYSILLLDFHFSRVQKKNNWEEETVITSNKTAKFLNSLEKETSSRVKPETLRILGQY